MVVAPPFLQPSTGQEFKGAETCVCAKIRLGTPLMTSKKKTVNWKQQNSQIYSCYSDSDKLSFTLFSMLYHTHMQVPPNRNKQIKSSISFSTCSKGNKKTFQQAQCLKSNLRGHFYQYSCLTCNVQEASFLQNVIMGLILVGYFASHVMCRKLVSYKSAGKFPTDEYQCRKISYTQV